MHDGRPGGVAAFLHQLRREGRSGESPSIRLRLVNVTAADKTAPSVEASGPCQGSNHLRTSHSGPHLLPFHSPPPSPFMFQHFPPPTCSIVPQTTVSSLFEAPPGSWFHAPFPAERLPFPLHKRQRSACLSATLFQPTLLPRGGASRHQQNSLVSC